MSQSSEEISAIMGSDPFPHHKTECASIIDDHRSLACPTVLTLCSCFLLKISCFVRLSPEHGQIPSLDWESARRPDRVAHKKYRVTSPPLLGSSCGPLMLSSGSRRKGASVLLRIHELRPTRGRRELRGDRPIERDDSKHRLARRGYS
jgi:hypothetical protein